jgi:mutual gliding-motility protein MglA
MVSINYATREVTCKIVYYGPGLSGKTTNLIYVHKKVPQTSRSKLISLATEADRTLYFDFLPINIGSINGFAAKFQLYTVPGQVYYNATRKLVLRGVDGLVFVADSQADKMDENIESLTNLKENLEEYGYDIDDLPIVIQYNKRDLPGALTVDELNARLNPQNWKSFEGEAVNGRGVFDTLKMIIKLVLEKAKSSSRSASSPKEKPAQTAESKTTEETAAMPDGSPPLPTEQAKPIEQAKPVGHVSPPESVPVRETAYDADVPVTNNEPQGQNESQAEKEAPTFEHNAVKLEPVAPPVAQETSVGQPTGEETADGSYSRPYPGSTGKIARRDRRITVSDFQPASRDDEDSSIPKGLTEDDTSVEGDAELAGMPSPKMAPSQRVTKKKRGFFKRLFGIK